MKSFVQEPDKLGFYGDFGGAFVPEILFSNVDFLQKNYLQIIRTDKFREEWVQLLRDYVGRPSPLFYAASLSEKYKAKIYLKREDLNHTGSHKINNALGQILLARHMGKNRIIAETGAGQHGVATATVCALMGMECIVYMGEKDMKRQAPNVARMKMLGAEVRSVASGSRTLKDATNEAIRDWIHNPEDTYYLIGSVVGPHPYPDMVAKFQSIISEEIREQILLKEGRNFPDKIIACVGGGSNAAGAFYDFIPELNTELIAVEAAGKGEASGFTAATIATGTTGVLHGSMTLLMQDENGQICEPYSISAGLDYPGIGPMHAHLSEVGRVRTFSVTDDDAVEAAFLLAKTEGIIPALESAHAIAALNKLTLKNNELIVINLSGRGDKDMETYLGYLNEK